MYQVTNLRVDRLAVACYLSIAVTGLFKAFKYRAYCSPRTAQNVQRHLDITREVYNDALRQRRGLWEHTQTRVSFYDQEYQLTIFKKTRPHYRKVGSHVLYEALRRLDRAFQAFFRRCKKGEKPGYPRFKAYNRWDSLIFPDHRGWKLQGKYLKVRNIGTFKLKLSRPLEGEIRVLTLRRDGSGKWYACFCCRNVPPRPQPKTGKTVGIDLGLSSFITTSEGVKVENPRHFKHGAERLKKAQQRLSRKKRDSNRRKEAKRQVVKAYEKISNQRRDFHFKQALLLVKAYDLVAVEDLKPSQMNSWKALNREKSDAAWSQFLGILAFKAEEAGKRLVRVDRRNTTKTCSRCGGIKDMPLSERVYRCSSCGLEMDRDLNAARNILARAGPAGKSACHGLPRSVV